MVGDAAALATGLMPYALAALRAYGQAVLAQESAASGGDDAPAGVGRRILRQVFGSKKEGESLPPVLARVVDNADDDDYAAGLRVHIRHRLESDFSLLNDLSQVIAEASSPGAVNQFTVFGPGSASQNISMGRDSYHSGRDMFIRRDK